MTTVLGIEVRCDPWLQWHLEIIGMKCLCCRVRASLVCRTWLEIEAAYPVQHTRLVAGAIWDCPNNICRLQWDLRDVSRLVRLELNSVAVSWFSGSEALAHQAGIFENEELALHSP